MKTAVYHIIAIGLAFSLIIDSAESAGNVTTPTSFEDRIRENFRGPIAFVCICILSFILVLECCCYFIIKVGMKSD